MPFDAQVIHWPTIADFAAHLQAVPRPAFVKRLCHHNTYKPNELTWKGRASMQSMRAYYIEKGWSSGPHLFLAAASPNPADRGIFQLTPLIRPGTHAGECNADSIGIESVGDFQARAPTPAQYALLIDVTRLLLRHWGLPPEAVTVHNACMPGRTCPGKFLTGTQIRADLRKPAPRPAPPFVSRASPLLSPARASAAQCVAWLLLRPNGEYTPYDVKSIVDSYYAQSSGLDPLLAIAQMAHETASLSSWWSQRPRRNPAGIGVTGGTIGLSFASWSDAARAHTGRLLAYALPKGSGTPEQQALIDRALALRSLPASYRGAAPTLHGLNGRWASPGVGYADTIAAIANAIARM